MQGRSTSQALARGGAGTLATGTKQARNARVQRSYTDAEVVAGLTVLAEQHGSARKASEALAERGIDIPRSTLDRWRREQYPERYREVVQDTLPRIQARIAELNEDLAIRQSEVEGLLTDSLKEQAGDIQPRDLPGAIRNIATSRGINQDKAKLYRGEATQIVGNPVEEAADALAALRKKGILIEGTAEEIPPE